MGALPREVCHVQELVKVKVDDPERLPDLMAALLTRIDAVATQTAPNELEVSLLGSRNAEADVAELEQRIRRWGEGAHLERDRQLLTRASSRGGGRRASCGWSRIRLRGCERCGRTCRGVADASVEGARNDPRAVRRPAGCSAGSDSRRGHVTASRARADPA